MVTQHAPKYLMTMRLGATGCDGSGIRLGQSAGGATGRLEKVSAWRFINPPTPWAKGVVVGPSGKRFCNEASYGARLGVEMCESQDGRAWLVLDAKLRKDPRVVVMEQTNARALDPRVFDDQPSLAVVDVAFISLEKVLPAVFGVLAPRSEIVALVKPQFEVGRQHVGKGGVVRDPAQHRAVVQRLARYAVLRGWHVLSVTASPLRGPKGNREFFLHLSAQGRTTANLESLIERAVVEALA